MYDLRIMERPTKYDQIDCEDGPQPSEPGFYPGCVCWESNEGAFPEGLEWDGQAWSRDDGPPVYYVPERFAEKKDAEARARELDLGW